MSVTNELNHTYAYTRTWGVCIKTCCPFTVWMICCCGRELCWMEPIWEATGEACDVCKNCICCCCWSCTELVVGCTVLACWIGTAFDDWLSSTSVVIEFPNEDCENVCPAIWIDCCVTSCPVPAGWMICCCCCWIIACCDLTVASCSGVNGCSCPWAFTIISCCPGGRAWPAGEGDGNNC